MRRAAFYVALALAAAGCATPGASAVAPTVAPPVLDPAEFGVTCGDELAFHPALLAQAGRAETDPDPAAEALRVWLGGPDSPGFPDSGWIRVGETPSKVQFLAPNADGSWHVIGFLMNQGAWIPDIAGSCTPEIDLPNGVSRATLRLDPAFPAPAGADRQVHLLVNETACASGQSPEGRVLPPFVTATADRVLIGVLVTSRPGGQECPGNPEFPVTVDLAEPLGDRPLLDATVIPAAPIGAGPAGAGGPADFAGLEDVDVHCGTVDAATCADLARSRVDVIEQGHGKRVASIEILDSAGSYKVVFADGDWHSMIVD